jgi:hypothetical protein
VLDRLKAFFRGSKVVVADNKLAIAGKEIDFSPEAAKLLGGSLDNCIAVANNCIRIRREMEVQEEIAIKTIRRQAKSENLTDDLTRNFAAMEPTQKQAKEVKAAMQEAIANLNRPIESAGKTPQAQKQLRGLQRVLVQEFTPFNDVLKKHSSAYEKILSDEKLKTLITAARQAA